MSLVCNSRYFGDKISLNERLVLFRSFRAKITQSHTAITSIVFSVILGIGVESWNQICRARAIQRIAEAIQKNPQNNTQSNLLTIL